MRRRTSLCACSRSAPALGRGDHQGKVLRIILAGQPELNDKLDAPELVQLASASACAFIRDASIEDMRAYIQHRLEVAGAPTRDLQQGYLRGNLSLFGRRAATRQYALRHFHAGGLQRRPRHRGIEEITTAVEELRWVDFSTRASHLVRSGKPEVPASPAAATMTRICGRACARVNEGRTVQELPLRVAASSSAAPPTTTCRSIAAS